MMYGPDNRRSQFQRGQKVYFGRRRGEQTLGEIVKLNPKSAKVKQLEDRGTLRDHPVGTIWTVPYGLLQAADGTATPGTPPAPQPREPLTYSPFAGADNHILQAIASVYSDLSPENLFADGERSVTQARLLEGQLRARLKHLQAALGRDVLEGEIYEWTRSRDAWHREHKAS